MTNQDLLFQNAELSLGAYAALDFGPTNTDRNRDALFRADMSPAQAAAFVTRFPTIITQFNDTPAEGGMGTSFSATVFKNTSAEH